MASWKNNPAELRFEKNYLPEPNSGCWLWVGSDSNERGYGTLFVKGKAMKAHRFSYEREYGKIPDGLVIDHLCKTPSCVNPAHLEAVTQKVNMQRGANQGKRSAYCYRGHIRSGDNLYTFPDGKTACRECTRISVRKYQQTKRKAELNV